MDAADIVIYVLLVALAGLAFFFARRESAARVEAEERADRVEAKARVLLGSIPDRYEVRISDWGPDFTGEHDILPRWRWVVVDAEHSLKLAFDPEYDARETKVRMLGNEPTKAGAYIAAMQWIEEQDHPLIVVNAQDL